MDSTARSNSARKASAAEPFRSRYHAMQTALPKQRRDEIRLAVPLPAGYFKAGLRPRNRPNRTGIKIP